MKTKNKPTDPPKSLTKYLNDPKRIDEAKKRREAEIIAAGTVSREQGLNPVYPEFILPAAKILKPIKGALRTVRLRDYAYPALRAGETAQDAYSYLFPTYKRGGKVSTKKYYDSNPEAKQKKKEYDTKYHSTEERKKYRAFLNKMNRKAGKYGNGDGLDYDHDEKRFMKATKNRAKK
jgi:hypothetical protein